jgi:plastocyanin
MIVDAVGTSSWNPAGVTINVNDIVQWNNVSGFAHTVTSTTVPTNGTFDVALANGASVCLKFTAAGTFNYQCSIHPVMMGSVTVN